MDHPSSYVDMVSGRSTMSQMSRTVILSTPRSHSASTTSAEILSTESKPAAEQHSHCSIAIVLVGTREALRTQAYKEKSRELEEKKTVSFSRSMMKQQSLIVLALWAVTTSHAFVSSPPFRSLAVERTSLCLQQPQRRRKRDM